jgi:hypothetical protein
MSWRSILLLGVASLSVVGPNAAAQLRPRPCAVDIKAYCTDIEPGAGRVAACIKEHVGDFSPACKARLITAIVTTRACASDVKAQCTRKGYTKKESTACLREALPNLSNLCKTAVLVTILRGR